jgi:hypothetical protein
LDSLLELLIELGKKTGTWTAVDRNEPTILTVTGLEKKSLPPSYEIISQLCSSLLRAAVPPLKLQIVQTTTL